MMDQSGRMMVESYQTHALEYLAGKRIDPPRMIFAPPRSTSARANPGALASRIAAERWRRRDRG
jgi:hypothetical protein